MHPKECCDGQRTGYRGQCKQQAILPREEREKQSGDDGTHHCAGVVHGAMEAEDAAARRGVGMDGQHRVARGAADAFASAIEGANRQHLRP